MPATSIDLPDLLKERAATAARRAGTSLEQFILDAIAEKTGLDETRAAMHAQADERLAQFRRTGETVSLSEMEEFLDKRVVKEDTPYPVPKQRRA